MDIKTANEILAYYDGRKKTILNGEAWWSDPEGMDSFQWKEDDLKYHSDYNWFMRVWKKYLSLNLIEQFALDHRRNDIEFIAPILCYGSLETACMRFAEGIKEISFFAEFKVPSEVYNLFFYGKETKP